MKTEVLFDDKITTKIWSQYFKRLNHELKPFDESIKEELNLEIQDHLFTSFQQEKSKEEAERLLNAIERLGEPKEFLRPMLMNKLLIRASKTLKPKSVFTALYYHLFGGVRQILTSLLFSVGYLSAFLLAFLAVLKPFFPKNVGLIILKDGGHFFGIVLGRAVERSDVFGYWFIPLALVVSIMLYVFLTKSLQVIKKRSYS